MTNELTLENIRSGAFPSDAHAVGFLLGEIERLQAEVKGLPKARKCMASATSDPPQDCDAPFCGCDPAWSACIEMLQECNLLVRRHAHEPCEQRCEDRITLNDVVWRCTKPANHRDHERQPESASRDASSIPTDAKDSDPVPFCAHPVAFRRYDGAGQPYCEKCGASGNTLRTGPSDLVGALQDVVHTDPGPVRAGKSVKSSEQQENKNGN